MHDAGGHLLRQGKITGGQGLLVNGFGFQAASSTGGHFVGFQFGRGPIKDVDGFDAHRQQRGRSVKEAHQVRHRVTVGIPKRHTVALR